MPQCGFCQSGMIMTTAALLAEIPEPTDADGAKDTRGAVAGS